MDTMNSTSSVFHDYEQELISLFDQLSNGNDTEEVQQQVLQQCSEILQQMSIEARSSSNMVQKQNDLKQYQEYKHQYQMIKERIERQSVIGAAPTASSSSSNPYSTIQETEQKVVQQNMIITNSLKSIHQTEQIAMETIDHLHQQRDVIQNTDKNTKTLQSLTQQANQITTNLLKPWWRKGV